jgi:hypothetical protein
MLPANLGWRPVLPVALLSRHEGEEALPAGTSPGGVFRRERRALPRQDCGVSRSTSPGLLVTGDAHMAIRGQPGEHVLAVGRRNGDPQRSRRRPFLCHLVRPCEDQGRTEVAWVLMSLSGDDETALTSPGRAGSVAQWMVWRAHLPR